MSEKKKLMEKIKEREKKQKKQEEEERKMKVSVFSVRRYVFHNVKIRAQIIIP